MEICRSKAIDVETPAVLVDMDVVDRNIRRFTSLADDHGVGLRSHAKVHKSPTLARKQIRRTGGGLLCQTLHGAEVMARAGVEDILLVRPAVTSRNVSRAVSLSEQLGRFQMVVDCVGNLDPVADATERDGTSLEVVLEIDLGSERGGVPSTRAALDLAERIVERPGLQFGGVLVYDNYLCLEADSDSEYERLAADFCDRLAAVVAAIRESGIEVPRVLTGSTATAKYVAESDVVTALTLGRYLFNDARMIEHRPDIRLEDCAVSVLATVISRPTADRALVDAGGKTLTFSPSPMPIPRNREDVSFYRFASEHGYVDVSDTGSGVSVGDTIEFVVHNVGGTVNLQDSVYAVRDGQVVDTLTIGANDTTP